MKKLSLTLFIVFISGIGFAQSAANSYTKIIDSIQNLLNKNPKEDTTKVKRLNDLALLCLFDMQFERGVLVAKQARQISQKIKYPKGEGQYFLFMQSISNDINLSWFYEHKRTMYYADIKEKVEFNNLIELYPLNREPQKLITNYLEALKYFEKENDIETMAHLYSVISANYQNLNKINESLQYADQAIRLYTEASQPELAFIVLLQKIAQLHSIDKMQEAKEVEKEAKAFLANVKSGREKTMLNYQIGLMYVYQVGNQKKALGFEHLLKADYELEKLVDKNLRIRVLETLGFSFDHVGMYQKAVDYFNKAIEIRNETNQYDDIALIYLEVVFELVALKKFDEAKLYLDKAKSFVSEIKNKRNRKWFEARTHDAAGQLLMGQGKYREALDDYFLANKIAQEFRDEDTPKYFNSYIAQCYQKLGDWEKSLYYGEKSYNQILKSHSEDWLKINTSLLLSEVYDQTGQFKKAFEYLKKYKNHVKEKEEQDIANFTTNLAIENFTKKNEKDKAAYEKEKLIIEHQNRNQRWWIFSIAAALLSSLGFLFYFYRNNRQKHKANTILQEQKDKVESTLSLLKATQAQLIQSEKLASLGELTAGIAHEIQNPLNFVNNFSEVSTELVVEMKEELSKGNIADASEIAEDLKLNLEKINQHGQRASSIVKGMLEHSRTSSGEKSPTDLNALCDEYLRLSYHGLRAKDKSFNADFELIADPNLPKVNVIPQDMGRVLLNLINNAFWAVHDKKLKLNDSNYKPKVTLFTRIEKSPSGDFGAGEGVAENVLISVQDNGNGIPKENIDKIFQPFFTTKPTGQGTGLGLSLSYDIVKAHSGALSVESTEGEGTIFSIKLVN